MSQPTPNARIAALLAEAVGARSSGALDSAERLYEKIVALDRSHAVALHDLGVICSLTGRYTQAVSWYEECLRVRPGAADTHNNLGVVFKEMGNVERAHYHLAEAIRLRVDYPEAYNNLGTLKVSVNDPESACGWFKRAVELHPGYALAWSNLGRALMLMGRTEEGLAPLQRAIALAPQLADAYAALGAALALLGRYPEASNALERAVALRPNRIEILADLVHVRQQLCDWEHLQRDTARIRAHVATAERCSVSPFSFMMLPGSTPAEQRRCAASWSSVNLGWARERREALGFTYAREPGRRLRIGYLSAHYHDHPTMYSIAGVFERHDRGRFEIFGFSYGPDSTGPMRRRVRAGLDHFVELQALSDEDAAQTIHKHKIDLLIDLKGYTRNARPGILALHPAAIQLGYLEYTGTTGSDFLDYYIADPYVLPAEQARTFSERVKYLPDCYQCNDADRVRVDPPFREAVGLREDAFVFCSFNQTYKITPEVFDIWCRLLSQVADSVLWLWASNPHAPENLRREAAARGVDPERLVFARTLRPAEQHRARIELADLALDTFPCNSHSTAADALWVGVPLVTCSGDAFVSRVAGSILRALELPELVTTSLQEYETLALDLARDRVRLLAIRERIEANRMTAPLFDTERSTRNLEAVYEQIWREYLESSGRAVA